MKQLLLLLSFLISISSVTAQFDVNNAIYTTGELNLGNYIGFDMNLNYVYQEKYSFKVGYTGNLRKPKSQPDDYSSGLSSIFLFGLDNPYDQMENYQIGVGRIYKLNKKGTIRLNASFGIGYTVIREPENWERVNDSGFLGENYSWNYSKYNTVSLILNPKIEFPFSRFYGLTLSPMLQINKDRTYFGIGIGQMLGLLRERKR
ncbi:hypothetical protein [Flavobacterium orientale]|uniref:Outer membrane protein beta-barrel domain-containing protein n=1 Tax=Flavobacterium orientale TaxID=1756020 RepID=A0A917DD49_9FLAO|nr:hypothetical protein [Flavobacterium orientale]GGD27605.1 hypothetical protein GCM10011343_17240 [Flavobacterium orientale]